MTKLNVSFPLTTIAAFVAESKSVTLTREDKEYFVTVWNPESGGEMRRVAFRLEQLISARESFKAAVIAILNTVGTAPPAAKHEHAKRV